MSCIMDMSALDEAGFGVSIGSSRPCAGRHHVLARQWPGPRRTIGSVNAAEFFLALASGVSFAVLGGFTLWSTIAGLIFGGLFAAPLAAVLTKYAPTKVLLTIVGLLITGLSAYNLWSQLH